MDDVKFNAIFRKIILIFLILIFMLIVLDVTLHQKYGQSDDPQEHMSYINEIMKLKSLPTENPMYNIDKMDYYPLGHHTFLATIINLTGVNKYAFVFRYACSLFVGIIFLLVFVFIRRITNENIALLVMIILFFAGGIGWILYPCILNPQVIGECFGKFAENTGLYSSTNFLSRLLYPTTHSIGILLILLFLLLFNRKDYLLAAITLSALSYTHMSNFVFASILLIPLMISVKKEEIKAIIIPLVVLLLSFGWNFFPDAYPYYHDFLPNFIGTEDVLRLFLLISVILFFVLNRKFTKPLFKLTLLLVILSIILDAFFHFNKTMPFELPFYKVLFFLYGPLLIGFLFMHKLRYSSEIYCLLITCLVLTQLHAEFTIMNPQRVLIILFIPLAIIYATLIQKSGKNYKIILVLLLCLILTGSFWMLNHYTTEKAFGYTNIDQYNKSLIFIKGNLPENSRIITSPKFSIGTRASIIIPSIAERYIYTQESYDFAKRLNMTPKSYWKGEYKDSGLRFEDWLKEKRFLYDSDYDSRLLQVGYLFDHPEMNISGTKIKELATHILTVKKECSLFEPHYSKIYEDDKVCIFEIKKD